MKSKSDEERLAGRIREVTILVLRSFGGDEAKTKAWFEQKNSLLGDVTPNEMIAVGRVEKLLKWVRLQVGDR